MKCYLITLAILSVLLFYSCKKDKEITPVPDFGYSYFPVNEGHWVIYDVDSIHYDDFKNSIDTFKYQIKEVIVSHFTDNTGKQSEKIERFYRKDSSQLWQIKDVWSSTRTATNAEKVEENQTIVKLVFPVQEGKRWNGNAFNNLGEQEFKYEKVNEKLEINSLSFDSTLTVLQFADSNLIEKKFSKEVYAKHVGMVYKKYENVADKDGKIEHPFLETRITSGVKYTYKINSFGN